MRLQGRITRWDDENGFGFISWHGDESTVFVHIKAISGTSRRLVVGDIVTYEIIVGKNGKYSAVNVRFSDQSRQEVRTKAKRKDSAFAILFTVFFLCCLFGAAYLKRISWFVLIAYFLVSVLTFLAYAWDKSSARNGRWRTEEFTLHVMSLLGGWPGALAAQRILRHKSAKREFLFVFWITAILNVAAVAYLAWVGDESFINQFIVRFFENLM